MRVCGELCNVALNAGAAAPPPLFDRLLLGTLGAIPIPEPEPENGSSIVYQHSTSENRVNITQFSTSVPEMEQYLTPLLGVLDLHRIGTVDWWLDLSTTDQTWAMIDDLHSVWSMWGTPAIDQRPWIWTLSAWAWIYHAANSRLT